MGIIPETRNNDSASDCDGDSDSDSDNYNKTEATTGTRAEQWDCGSADERFDGSAVRSAASHTFKNKTPKFSPPSIHPSSQRPSETRKLEKLAAGSGENPVALNFSLNSLV